MDDGSPIDIPYDKLISWLLERRQLPSTWQNRLKEIADQHVKAIASLPKLPQLDTLRHAAATSITYNQTKAILSVSFLSKHCTQLIFLSLSFCFCLRESNLCVCF